MKKILIMSLCCLAAFWPFCKAMDAFGQKLAQILIPSQSDPDNKVIVVSGVTAGNWRTWLTVESHNGKDFPARGFDPCYTRVIADYKPLFRHLPGGQWEIMFVQETP